MGILIKTGLDIFAAFLVSLSYGEDPGRRDIPLIEPDTRGAVTLREHLVEDRESNSCKRCHEKIATHPLFIQ